MSDGVPMQASGQKSKGARNPDGVNSAGEGAGEGGAYPNPHTGSGGADGNNPDSEVGGFMGHGGQSTIDYSGPEQLGREDKELGDDNRRGDNVNAVTSNE